MNLKSNNTELVTYEEYRKPVIEILSLKYKCKKYDLEDAFNDGYFTYIKKKELLSTLSKKKQFYYIMTVCDRLYSLNFLRSDKVSKYTVKNSNELSTNEDRYLLGDNNLPDFYKKFEKKDIRIKLKNNLYQKINKNWLEIKLKSNCSFNKNNAIKTIDLLFKGYTVKEIAKELNTNIKIVYKYIKKYAELKIT